MIYDSTIFETLIRECKNNTKNTVVSKQEEKLDITESIKLNISDENINKSKCSLIAYGIHVNESDATEAYNQKNNPQKAIDIFFEYPQDNLVVEVFLETETKEWNSKINGKQENRLSPDQMQQFFKTNFFKCLKEKLEKTWPCEKDPLFRDLRDCLVNKRYKIDFTDISRKEENDGNELNEWEVRRRKVKLGQPNEKDKNGNKIRSSSGRKLIHFSDMGVSKGDEAYYSWPGGTDDKHVFKWSRWNNWENQRPFVRARIGYSIDSFTDMIGISMSPFTEDDKNRGFKSFNLSLEPILQYLTPEETQDILNLSIIRKFLKTCVERIEKVLSIPDEEIFKKINRPDKCTLDDIRKTKRVFRNTLKAVKDARPDTFVYTN